MDVVKIAITINLYSLVLYYGERKRSKEGGVEREGGGERGWGRGRRIERRREAEREGGEGGGDGERESEEEAEREKRYRTVKGKYKCKSVASM